MPKSRAERARIGLDAQPVFRESDGAPVQRITHDDGLDSIEELRFTPKHRDGKTFLESADAKLFTEYFSQVASAATFDGLIEPIETYWRRVPITELEQLQPARLKPLSKAWYASQIIEKIDWLRRIVREGPTSRPESDIAVAIQLGMLIEDARWRFSRGEQVKKGVKVHVNARNANRASVAVRADRARVEGRGSDDELRAIIDGKPREAIRKIKRNLVPKFGPTVDAVRKRIERLNK